MAMRVEWPRDPQIQKRLAEVQDAVRPQSRIRNRFRKDLADIVHFDHERKMLTNITRYGDSREPLSPRTLMNRKRGPGPSLVPWNVKSRYITTFGTEWKTDQGRDVLSMSFRGFVSKTGFPIPLAHEHGARRGNWRLPARPVMGVTPQGSRQAETRFHQFTVELARGH